MPSIARRPRGGGCAEAALREVVRVPQAQPPPRGSREPWTASPAGDRAARRGAFGGPRSAGQSRRGGGCPFAEGPSSAVLTQPSARLLTQNPRGVGLWAGPAALAPGGGRPRGSEAGTRGGGSRESPASARGAPAGRRRPPAPVVRTCRVTGLQPFSSGVTNNLGRRAFPVRGATMVTGPLGGLAWRRSASAGLSWSPAPRLSLGNTDSCGSKMAQTVGTICRLRSGDRSGK